MIKRSIRTPVTVLACALICGAALIATNIGTVVYDGNWSPIRSDIRIVLATAVIVAVIRLVQVVRTEAHDALLVRLSGHEARLNHHADRIEELERTQPIPRPFRGAAEVTTGRVVATVGTATALAIETSQPEVDAHLDAFADAYELGRLAGLAEAKQDPPAVS